jgi:hypothetical protein
MYNRITQIRGTHVVAGLQRTYETILGEKKRLEKAEYEWEGVENYQMALDYYEQATRVLDNLLNAIETTIRLFEPKWDRSKPQPRVRQLGPKTSKQRSDIVASVFEILRSALAPLTIAEIAQKVAVNLGVKTTRRDQRERMYSAVHSNLKRYHAKGLVVRTPDKPARWVLPAIADRAA